MDKKQQLSIMIDSIINGDNDAAKAAFSPYIQAKTRDVLGYSEEPQATQPVTEHVLMAALREWIDMEPDDNPVKLQGDRVIVNGKQVGVVQTDLTDFDSGINFIEEGNRFTKEFNDLPSLYKFLIDRYTKGNK